MQNTDTLKLWSAALAPGFPLDVATFLIISLLPHSYVIQGTETDLVVVDVADIRKHAKSCTEEGINKLLKIGYAKWAGKTKDQIAIGTSRGVIRTTYYFMSGETVGVTTTAPKPEMKMTDDPQMIPTLDLINNMFKKYEVFCEQIEILYNPDYVHGKINTAIKTAYKSQFTSPGLLDYLNALNAMAFEWSAIPQGRNNRDLATAKRLITKIDSRTLIGIVPFFVLNYHKIARKGFTETSITNLDFNINTILTQYGKQKTVSHGTDTDTL